jgi:hypothetical protein
MFRRTISVLAAALLISTPQGLFAQTSPAPAPAQPASDSSQQLLGAAQVDALVAPIALYPDALLSEVLMASTYPLEVVEGARWAKANKSLKGDALKSAIDKQTWDDSIKSLVATPEVLEMMSEKLSWTQQLGDAVLAQQPDVMDAVQRLRTKAQANNKLASNKQQTVKTEQQNNKQVIVIEPTEPETLYVPYYDPAVVYGAWPYPAYPPYYWPPPAYIGGGLIAAGIVFGAGFALGRWAAGGYWGGGVNWGGNNININRNTNINNINRGGNNINRGGNNWTHNPAHRQGVRYNNSNVANKFGGKQNLPGASNRMDFRGRGGNQVLNPGAGGAGNRPNAGGGNRPNAGGGGAGNRPSAGNRPATGGGANRPNAGGGANRPSAGNRPSTGARPGGGGGNAFGNISSGRAASSQAARGRSSMGGGGGARGGGGGGGAHRGGGGGGGGARGGGGGGGGGRGGGGGGGRRSDMRLKHDIVMLGRLDDGLGYYRFTYNGGHTTYVGVMAQEVQSVMPEAVMRGPDGYLRVYYDKIGVKFETYADWLASGARLPDPASHAQ